MESNRLINTFVPCEMVKKTTDACVAKKSTTRFVLPVPTILNGASIKMNILISSEYHGRDTLQHEWTDSAGVIPRPNRKTV